MASALGSSASAVESNEQCNQPGLPRVDFLIKWNPRSTDVCVIYRAARLISTGRRLILGLGANDRSANAIARLHGELFRAGT